MDTDTDMGPDPRYSACSRGKRICVPRAPAARDTMVFANPHTHCTMHSCSRSYGTGSPPCKADASNRGHQLRQVRGERMSHLLPKTPVQATLGPIKPPLRKPSRRGLPCLAQTAVDYVRQIGGQGKHWSEWVCLGWYGMGYMTSYAARMWTPCREEGSIDPEEPSGSTPRGTWPRCSSRSFAACYAPRPVGRRTASKSHSAGKTWIQWLPRSVKRSGRTQLSSL